MDEISPSRFYGQYQGHPIEGLQTFYDITRTQRPGKPIIWFAGDSSLDNKFWVLGSGPGGEPIGVEVPEIYHYTLVHATPKPDVACWMNHVMGSSATCINTAVEASLLRERDMDLLPHDKLIQGHMKDNDVLIVSVGCNDIAMKPTFSTIWRMLVLAWLTPQSSIDNGSAWTLGYFSNIFGARTESYIKRICKRTTPRAVVVCMIYYPLEAGNGQRSWADTALSALGYNRNPGKLQSAIRKMFEQGTEKIKVEGTEVIPCRLFDVLDGSKKTDYVERVEPSSAGGRKMAELFKTLVDRVIIKA